MSTAPVAERRRTGAAVWALRIAGAALLAVMGAIHLWVEAAAIVVLTTLALLAGRSRRS